MIGSVENLALDETLTQLVGEQLLFELLGRILYANPSRAWVDPLLSEGIFAEVPFAADQADVIEGLALLAQWTDASNLPLSDAALTELRTDFVQLFMGNLLIPAPLWELVYFDEMRQTFQRETLDVRAYFTRLGLQINSNNREPDDHIAFELTFVARCAELAVAAREREDDAAFAELLSIQRAFLENHLLRWGCKWAELVQRHARTDFYRGLALLVSGGLKELSRITGVEIPTKLPYPGLGIHQPE